MKMIALLIVMVTQTDFAGVYTEYKFKFPTMGLCMQAVALAKMTEPASENETTVIMVCIPWQETRHVRFPTKQ